MKKKVIIISSIVLVILICISIFIFLKYNEKPNIILKDNLDVSIYEEVTNLSFIDSIKNGTIITKEEKLDTSKLGKLEVKLILRNKFKKDTTYLFNINIIDTEKPSISYKKELETTEGVEIDLLKDIKAEDNSKEEIKVSIEGDYNFKTLGEYKIYYVAKDSSGNETKEEAI